MDTVNQNKPSAPVDLTEVSQDNPNVPTNLIETAKASPTVPTNLTELSQSSLGTPANLTELSQSLPTAPTNLTELSQGGLSTPSNLTELPQGFIRTLKPTMNMNFKNNVYSIGGNSGELTDLVAYDRAGTTASYIEEYKDQNGKVAYRVATDFVGSVTNLLKYSEDFTKGAWSSLNNLVTSKNVLNDTGLGDNRLSQSVSIPADTNPYTLYIDVENISSRYIGLRIDFFNEQSTSQTVVFDVLTGVVTAQNTNSVVHLIYQEDNIYRVGLTMQNNGQNTTLSARIVPSFNGDGSLSVNESLAGAIKVHRAQLTQSDKPLPYVETQDTPVTKVFTEKPRIEYNGYLSENTETNFILHSEDLFKSEWLKSNISTTKDDDLAPDGSYSADKVTINNGANIGSSNVRQTISKTTVAQTYSFSCFIKSAGYDLVRLRILGLSSEAFATIDLRTGEVIEETFTGDFLYAKGYVYPKKVNGYWRIKLTGRTDTHNQVTFMVIGRDSNDITGDGNRGYYLWGFQAEINDVMSSYIRTGTSPVTRSRDVMQLNIANIEDEFTIGVNSNYSETSGLLQFGRYSLDVYNDVNNRVLFANQSGFVNACRFRANNTTFVGLQNNNATNSDELAYTVMTYKDDNYNYYYNGILEGQMNDNTPLDLNKVAIGSNITNINQLQGNIKNVVIYDKALNENEVKTL